MLKLSPEEVKTEQQLKYQFLPENKRQTAFDRINQYCPEAYIKAVKKYHVIQSRLQARIENNLAVDTTAPLFVSNLISLKAQISAGLNVMGTARESSLNRLMHAKQLLTNSASTDLEKPEYIPIQEDFTWGEKGFLNNGNRFFTNGYEKDGYSVCLAWTYLMKCNDQLLKDPEPDYWFSIRKEGGTGFGVSSTPETALKQAKNWQKKSDKFHYDVKNKQWTHEELLSLRNWHLRYLAEKRQINNARHARIKTLISSILYAQNFQQMTFFKEVC